MCALSIMYVITSVRYVLKKARQETKRNSAKLRGIKAGGGSVAQEGKSEVATCVLLASFLPLHR